MSRAILRHIILFLLLSAAAVQIKAQLALQCDSPDRASKQVGIVLVWPDSAAETARMRQSPHGASRVGKHTLLVHWAGGVHTFKDKPPYDEPLDGVQWTYCGYSPKLNMHLIKKNDEVVFLGVLVDESSGAILPGGDEVVFSPDMKSYIAYEMQDGAALPMIKLYNRSGNLLWSGYHGLMSQQEGIALAEFDEVHWDSSGKLIAEYRETGKGKVIMALTKGSDARWRWVSQIPK